MKGQIKPGSVPVSKFSYIGYDMKAGHPTHALEKMR